MEIGYTEEQEALRRELRDYYSALLTPEVEEQLANSHGIGPDMRRVVKQMAKTAGWASAGPRSTAARAGRPSSSSSSSTSPCARAPRCQC